MTDPVHHHSTIPIPDSPTMKYIRSTSRKLSNLKDKKNRRRSPKSQKANTLLIQQERRSSHDPIEDLKTIKKYSSATNIARLLSIKSETEKNANPKDRIREFVKYALYGLRNPYQNYTMRNLKRGNSMGAAKKKSFENHDQMVKEWSEEFQKKMISSRMEEENKKLKKKESFESSSSSNSVLSHKKEERNKSQQERESGSNLNLSTISQKSNVFERFGTVSNFLNKIFTKDNLRSSLLRKVSNNCDFSQSDCQYLKNLRARQKEDVKKEIEIICDDQSRLNLSKPLLDKWVRARKRVKFAVRLKKFNYDIKIFGSTANVGTEICNEKNFMNKLYVKQETFIKKSLYQAKMNKEKKKALIAYPESPFMNYWSLVLMFLLFYTATITPYRVTFMDSSFSEWTVIDYFVDGLFMTDILVTLNLAFLDKNGKIIENRWQIVSKYFRGWLIIDVVGVFPFQFLDSSSDTEASSNVGGYNDFIKMLRLPRLYRLMKLTRLLKIMNQRGGFNIMTKIKRVLKLKPPVMKVINFFLMVMVFVHLMGCLWHFEAKLQNYSPQTWVYQ